MSQKERFAQIAQEKYEQLGSPVVVMAYLTHLIDLQNQVILDLASAVDQTKLSTEAKERLNLVEQVSHVSSVDFANVNDPMQAYKIPNAIALKTKSNILMQEYVTALAREGLLS